CRAARCSSWYTSGISFCNASSSPALQARSRPVTSCGEGASIQPSATFQVSRRGGGYHSATVFSTQLVSLQLKFLRIASFRLRFSLYIAARQKSNHRARSRCVDDQPRSAELGTQASASTSINTTL